MKKNILRGISFVLFALVTSYAQTSIKPSGVGSSEAPYKISSQENLVWISLNDSVWDKHFIQTDDIDISDSKNWNGSKGFSSIGKYSKQFTGYYNGKGKTIKGIYINKPDSNYIGLFGYIGNSAVIDSLGILNSDIKGNSFVAGLVGFMEGNETEIKNCYSSGNIEGKGNIGGLVGSAKGGVVIEKSYSSSNVLLTEKFGGGLVGYFQSDSSVIRNSYSTGSVRCNIFSIMSFGFGGLVGRNNGVIENSYSSSSVHSNSIQVGGLVGYGSTGSKVVNCYSVGKVTSSTKDLGGLIAGNSGEVIASFWDVETSGISESAGGRGKLTSQMHNYHTFTNVGWDFISETENGTDDYWEADEDSTVNNGYPIFVWQEGANGENGNPIGSTGYKLTVVTDGKGSFTLTPDGGIYDPGQNIEVSITPNEGYAFSHWSGDTYDDSVLPKVITINSDVEIVANFVKALPAFPGAEGGGAYTVGGRGGKVIEVTNLNANGPGSFKEACLTEGPRTIVFRVGGTIDLGGKPIILHDDKYSHLTIAGQTAPGEGIQIVNGDFRTQVDQIIIRYVRFRAGPAYGVNDALTVGSKGRINRKRFVMLDHISAYWGADETVDLGSFSDNLTIQWSIIAEGLHKSVCSDYESWTPYYVDSNSGKKYWEHSRGIMVSAITRNASIHHCIIYNSYKRNPLIQSSDCDIVNNVIVNIDKQIFLKPFKSFIRSNIVGNYFRNNSTIYPVMAYAFDTGYDGKSSFYCKDNYDAHYRPNSSYPEYSISAIANSGGPDGRITTRLTPFIFNGFPITTQLVHDAYQTVLNDAGVTVPARDATDLRIVNNVKSGIIPSQLVDGPPADYTGEFNYFGGYPTIASGTAPIDSDHDGMPDSWETSKGLNPNYASDRNGTNLSSEGYTNLEVYLNDIIATDIDDNKTENINYKYELSNNYPNPFNPTTTIKFTLAQSGKTQLSVYNILGQEVMVLVNKELKAGTHSYSFNGSGLSSGLYFYILQSNDYVSVKKMILLK